MKVHMARSETERVDINEKLGNRSSSEGNTKENPQSMQQKESKPKTAGDGTGTNVERWKEERNGRRREDKKVGGERKGRDLPGSTRRTTGG